MTPPLLAPGSLLGSRWIMGGLLGQSDGAEIYEAEETQRRRFAAIKFFDPAFAAEPAWSEHAAVTRALSELPGEGIARAYDIGLEPAFRRPYVASERITFPTLAGYVAARGPLSLRAIAQFMHTIAAGLDAAHAAGIVHGGLKPQNVFVSFDDATWARVTDFAVARLRAANGGGPVALLGWSAPEAAAGFVTAASDRYALGLLCFFAATGVPWYNALRSLEEPGSARQRATRVASERAKSQGGALDPSFDAWFNQALAADSAARFATAAEMARAFVDVFSGGPTSAFPARVPVHPLSDTFPVRSERGLEPAPETPMAAAVPVGGKPAIPWSSPRPPSFPEDEPASAMPELPKTLPASLWMAAAGALVALALFVWWLRTR